MSKYTWSGGFEETILTFDVVACRGAMTEQPNGLVVNRQAGHVTDIDADERFMIVLKIKGQWIASLHPHEVIKHACENK